MIITDRDDDTTLAECEDCGYRKVFPRILSTKEVLRLRCNCPADGVSIIAPRGLKDY